MRKIKIAYFELFEVGWHEDYSINPKRYGGGPVMARWAKEYWNNDKFEFKIFAPKGCWEHIDETKENKSSFIELPEETGKALLKGVNIKTFIPNIDYFDIILIGNTNQAINNQDCKCVQVHWSGFGRASDGHPFIPYTFVYGPDLTPWFSGQKTFPIKLGKPVPKEFVYNEKEDMIFQCTRHDESLNTIEVAQNCIKYEIKGYFGGPINGDYKLMDYIDNKNTFYLGMMKEEDKLDYTKRARMASFFYTGGCVFNQSVIECLAHGCAIFYKDIQPSKDPTFRNWLKNEIPIVDGYNGFACTETNFLECWEKSKNIDQRNCWLTAKKYSVEEMLDSFERGINFVVKDAGIL